jgi:hypothetical protein
MPKKKRNVVTQDNIDDALLESALISQGNAIPAAAAAIIRIAAPVIARLAVRYLARKYRKRVSDTAVNTTSQWIGEKIQGIIDRSGTK